MNGRKIAATYKSDIQFWIEKFDKDVQCDERVLLLPENQGWRVFTVWECELAASKVETNSEIFAVCGFTQR